VGDIDAVLPRRDVLSLLVDGHAYEIKREQTATDLHMWVGSTAFRGGTERSALAALAPEGGQRRKGTEENSGADAGPRGAFV